MSEIRKIAAILVADVVGYSRLAGADEDRTLSRLRTLRSDLIDPAVAVHHGRIVKRTGDGLIAEFRSVVEAVRCAIAMQIGLIERNVDMHDDRRIVFRIGVHLGDVVEEADGDLTATASISPLDWKPLPRRARSAFPRTPIGKSKGGSISRPTISASPNSRISLSRSGSTPFRSAFRPKRKRPQNP